MQVLISSHETKNVPTTSRITVRTRGCCTHRAHELPSASGHSTHCWAETGVIYRALHLSRKPFDTTSKGKFPGCPQSIRDIDSLVVKVSKLIHLQTVGEILRLRVQTIHHCVSHS